MKPLLASLLALTLLLVAQPAHAQASQPAAQADDDLNLSVGARIGGYGFREKRSDGVTWLDCRMDGAGVFGLLDLGSPTYFGELGLDFYSASDGLLAEAGDMDRLSLHAQAAIGARSQVSPWFVPYVQLGAGVEWTHLHLNHGPEAGGFYPSAFFGIGAEIPIHDKFILGSNLRVLAMAHPAHETHGEAHATDGEELRLDYAPAGQALFFVRYGL